MSHLTTVLDPNWRDRANCQGTDVDEFYPEAGHHSVLAKRICGGCDVKTECLEWALANGERGIWGGTGEPERTRILKARRQAELTEVAA